MTDKISALERDVSAAVGEKQKIDAMVLLADALRHSDQNRAMTLSLEISELSKTGEFATKHYIFGLASSMQTQGWLNFDYGSFHLGLRQSQESLAFFEQVDDGEGQLKSSFAIAGCHFALGNLSEALECQLNSLEISNALGDSQGKATLLENIGILYAQLDLFDEALQAMEQSLEYIDDHADVEIRPTTYNNLALTHGKLGNIELALEYSEKSLKLSREANHETGEIGALDTLGCIYLEDNNLKKALPLFEEVIERSHQIGNKSQEMETLCNIGSLHCLANREEIAIEYLEKACLLGKEMGANTMLMGCYLTLSGAYKETKDFEKAYENLQFYLSLREGIYSKEVQSKLSGLLVSRDIEMAKKETELNRIQNIALKLEISERKKAEQKQEELILKLQEALTKVKQLSGLLPICASCKDIRDEEGGWHKVEAYLDQRSDAQFSHSICPICVEKLYPGLDL